MSTSMLEHALSYARRGWFVFPCYPMRSAVCGCGRPQCQSPGKHPITINGLSEATTNENQITSWWTEVPDANIGVVMEPSGLCALDLDLYHNDLEKLAALEASLIPLPPTVTQQSGSGEGYHAIFKSPGFPVRGVIGGIVVRSKAYIIVAPSNHASGKQYHWQPDLGPDDIAVAEFPGVWQEALRKTALIGQVGVPTNEPEWLAVVPSEKRVADMRAHFAREKGEVKGVDTPGTTFNVVRSAIRGNAVCDFDAALEAAKEYSLKCIPPWGEDRIAHHVWNAYQRAHTPEWGFAQRGPEQILKGLGLENAPVVPAYVPPPPEPVLTDELDCRLIEASQERSKRISLFEKRLLKTLLEGGVPLGENMASAIETLLKFAPPGATDAQLAVYLVRCLVPVDEAIYLISEARAARAAATSSKVTLAPTAGLFDSLPVTDEVTPDIDIDNDSPPADDEALRACLSRNKLTGEVVNTKANLEKIVHWAADLGARVRFNLLTKRIEIASGRFKNKNANVLPTAVVNWISSKWGIETMSSLVEEQLLLVARANEYNPIAEYLISLKWDGVRRLDTWLIDYCGAQDTEFTRRISAMWMISACARGIHPGSKVDTVLVLEGRQGSKKSSTLKTLAGSWFSDTPLVIGNKDSLQVASCRWIIELAELSSLRSSETEAQKAFISASIDNYRPPYGKATEEFPRFAIFGGSTNEYRYLHDASGNRRYWPCAVSGCDVMGLKKVRDQLWAEAVYRYQSAELNQQLAHPLAPGERWWFEDEDELLMASMEVDKRRPENVWASIVRGWVAKPTMVGGSVKTRWTLAEIANQALDIDIEKLPNRQKAVSEALRESGLVEVLVDGQELWELSESAKLRIPSPPTQEQLAKTN